MKQTMFRINMLQTTRDTTWQLFGTRRGQQGNSAWRPLGIFNSQEEAVAAMQNFIEPIVIGQSVDYYDDTGQLIEKDKKP